MPELVGHPSPATEKVIYRLPYMVFMGAGETHTHTHTHTQNTPLEQGFCQTNTHISYLFMHMPACEEGIAHKDKPTPDVTC